MSSFIEYFFLGTLQGLSEFLPISSSGHLSLVQVFLKTNQNFLFVISAHFGTLFSLIIFYKKNLIYIFKNILKPFSKNLFLKITVGCLPVMTAGLLFYDTIKILFSSLPVVACGFGLTGFFLIGTKWIQKSNREDKINSYDELENISYKQALFMGLFQTISLLPGFSRSGITTASGILIRIHPSLALHFSFLMGGFVLLAASLFEFSKTNVEVFLSGPFIITFVSSFIFGYGALKVMKSWVFELYKIGIYLLFLSTTLWLHIIFL